MNNVYAISVIAWELKAPRVTYQKVVHVDAASSKEAKEICRKQAAEQRIHIVKMSARKVF